MDDLAQKRFVVAAAIVSTIAGCDSNRRDAAPLASVQEPTQTAHEPGAAATAEPSADTSRAPSMLAIGEAIGLASYIVEKKLEATRSETVPVAFVSGVALVPGENRAMHAHMGPPATLGLISYLVRNHDERPHAVRPVGLEFLRGDCRSEKWDETLDIEPVEWMRGPSRSELEDIPSKSLSLAPGEAVRLWSTHQTLRAFQRCDRFAYRMTLEVDGAERLTGELPVKVMRLSRRPVER